MAESPPITGRCLCGRVRFEVSEPLIEAEYCHCRRCQRRTGAAASASATTAPESFRITRGEESLSSYRAGGGWRDHFCRECGGSVYAQGPDGRGEICVSMGMIDGDPGVRPAYHQYVAYAAAWDALPEDGLPRFAEAAPSDRRSAPFQG